MIRYVGPLRGTLEAFCGRIRENSGVFGVAQKSHDFSYHGKPRLSAFQECFTALPFGAENTGERIGRGILTIAIRGVRAEIRAVSISNSGCFEV